MNKFEEINGILMEKSKKPLKYSDFLSEEEFHHLEQLDTLYHAGLYTKEQYLLEKQKIKSRG